MDSESPNNTASKSNRKTVLIIVIFLLILLSLLFILISVIFLTLLYFKKTTLSPSNESQNVKEYRILRINPTTNETHRGIVQIPPLTSSFLQYQKEDQNVLIYSMEQPSYIYQCQGTCYCESETQPERRAEYLIMWWLGTLAAIVFFSIGPDRVQQYLHEEWGIESAKKQIQKECETEFSDKCPPGQIKSELGECAPIPSLQTPESPSSPPPLGSPSTSETPGGTPKKNKKQKQPTGPVDPLEGVDLSHPHDSYYEDDSETTSSYRCDGYCSRIELQYFSEEIRGTISELSYSCTTDFIEVFINMPDDLKKKQVEERFRKEYVVSFCKRHIPPKLEKYYEGTPTLPRLCFEGRVGEGNVQCSKWLN